jgi:hypothetical protein
MIEENQDLNLETDHLEELIESPPPGQQVVVIQYRSRGVPWYLVLPLLVLIPIGAVAVYHRVSRRTGYTPPPSLEDRSIRKAVDGQAVAGESPEVSAIGAVQDSRPTSNAGSAAPLSLNSQPIAPGSVAALLPQPAVKNDQAKTGAQPARSGSTETERSKISSESDPTKAGPATTAATTLPAPATTEKLPGSQPPPNPAAEPPRPARGAVSIGFSVPADNNSPFAELAISRGQPGSTMDHNHDRPGSGEIQESAMDQPSDRPQPTQEQLLQDIQAEAAEKAAELRERRDIKDRAREVIDSETLARVEDERAAFRRDLRDAIKLSRREAAVQIDILCNRYGRNYGDDLRSKARFLLSRSGKMSREAKVRMLRLYGVPEPGILDFLANEIHHMINSRSGPRDSNEVRVDAAKQLLHIELVKDAAGANKGVSAPRVGPAASTAPNSEPGNEQAR